MSLLKIMFFQFSIPEIRAWVDGNWEVINIVLLVSIQICKTWQRDGPTRGEKRVCRWARKEEKGPEPEPDTDTSLAQLSILWTPRWGSRWFPQISSATGLFTFVVIITSSGNPNLNHVALEKDGVTDVRLKHKDNLPCDEFWGKILEVTYKPKHFKHF